MKKINEMDGKILDGKVVVIDNNSQYVEFDCFGVCSSSSSPTFARALENSGRNFLKKNTWMYVLKEKFQNFIIAETDSLYSREKEKTDSNLGVEKEQIFQGIVGFKTITEVVKQTTIETVNQTKEAVQENTKHNVKEVMTKTIEEIFKVIEKKPVSLSADDIFREANATKKKYLTIPKNVTGLNLIRGNKKIDIIAKNIAKAIPETIVKTRNWFQKESLKGNILWLINKLLDQIGSIPAPIFIVLILSFFYFIFPDDINFVRWFYDLISNIVIEYKNSIYDNLYNESIEMKKKPRSKKKLGRKKKPDNKI